MGPASTFGSVGSPKCGEWTPWRLVGKFSESSAFYETLSGNFAPDACLQLCMSTHGCTAFTAYDRSTSNCVWTDVPPHMLEPYTPQPWNGEDEDFAISMVMCEGHLEGGYPVIFGAYH